MAALRAAYQPGRGMAMAFGAFLEHVLGPHGLVVYDSSDPATKPLARDVFVREVSEPGNTARIAGRAGEALVAKGYHAQATLADGTVSVFHLNAHRAPIRVDGDQAYVGDTTMSLAQLVEEATTHPEHFSPNVLLRPLVQDTVFPTICYVAGPNELAYLGQLKEVYAHFGMPMPLMYQRGTATLADSATLRFLTKYDLPLTALRAQDESALNQLLESQLPPTVEQALTAVSSLIDERMGDGGRRGAADRSDARRRGEIHARQAAARSAGAAQQGHSGGEAARRHAAAPVPARAGPHLPPGPPAGT